MEEHTYCAKIPAKKAMSALHRVSNKAYLRECDVFIEAVKNLQPLAHREKKSMRTRGASVTVNM